MEEFGKAKYNLDEIKELLGRHETRLTRRSFNDAQALGYSSIEAMVERVCKIQRSEFFKTMTKNNDHTLWQDVYKTRDEERLLYIKVQKSHDEKGVIISFHDCD